MRGVRRSSFPHARGGEPEANRVPHVYRLYEGEGHGFRKAETLADYYQTAERFLREQVIYNVSKGAS